MSHVLLVVALAAVGAYVVRFFWPAQARDIDVGAVSNGWIAEHRREESPR